MRLRSLRPAGSGEGKPLRSRYAKVWLFPSLRWSRFVKIRLHVSPDNLRPDIKQTRQLGAAEAEGGRRGIGEGGGILTVIVQGEL